MPVHHFLEQAPVEPVDADGIVVMPAGTGLFAVVSVLLALYRDQLATAGHVWWLGVAVSGFVLGLIGTAYCWIRRRRRRAGRWSAN